MLLLDESLVTTRGMPTVHPITNSPGNIKMFAFVKKNYAFSYKTVVTIETFKK